MYKIHISMVPDLGFISDHHPRTGTKYFAKHNNKASNHVKNIRFSSFFSRGPTLFNLLPAELRTPAPLNMTSEDKKTLQNKFKKRLDKWLELIPDQPTTEGLAREAETNSLINQLATHGREVADKWKEVSRRLDEEEQHTTSNTTNTTNTNTSVRPVRRRYNNYGRLTDDNRAQIVHALLNQQR